MILRESDLQLSSFKLTGLNSIPTLFVLTCLFPSSEHHANRVSTRCNVVRASYERIPTVANGSLNFFPNSPYCLGTKKTNDRRFRAKLKKKKKRGQTVKRLRNGNEKNVTIVELRPTGILYGATHLYRVMLVRRVLYGPHFVPVCTHLLSIHTHIYIGIRI